MCHQEGLKLNGTHQLFICADNVNMLGRNIITIKRNTEALLVAGKEDGLKTNTEKT
jgi:hypothetical protein